MNEFTHSSDKTRDMNQTFQVKSINYHTAIFTFTIKFFYLSFLYLILLYFRVIDIFQNLKIVTTKFQNCICLTERLFAVIDIIFINIFHFIDIFHSITVDVEINLYL